MRSMPAVHTIPQKLDRVSVTKSARRWPAVHTIPQKQMREQKARELALSLLSTLSPKNSNTSPTCKINTLACCPHYPPKTSAERRRSQGNFGLLSTLSPKNTKPLRLQGRNSKACCPHYPPKTEGMFTTRHCLRRPAVHTIPQKREICRAPSHRA